MCVCVLVLCAVRCLCVVWVVVERKEAMVEDVRGQAGTDNSRRAYFRERKKACLLSFLSCVVLYMCWYFFLCVLCVIFVCVEFERKEAMVEDVQGQAWTDNSRRAYFREFKKVCVWFFLCMCVCVCVCVRVCVCVYALPCRLWRRRRRRWPRFERKEAMVEDVRGQAWTDNSRRAYFREFKKVCVCVCVCWSVRACLVCAPPTLALCKAFHR